MVAEHAGMAYDAHSVGRLAATLASSHILDLRPPREGSPRHTAPAGEVDQTADSM